MRYLKQSGMTLDAVLDALADHLTLFSEVNLTRDQVKRTLIGTYYIKYWREANGSAKSPGPIFRSFLSSAILPFIFL